MSFKEKSAWVMCLALAIGALFYGYVVIAASAGLDQPLPPLLPVFVVYVLILIVVSIIGHVLAAITGLNEASVPGDERDRLIASRASHISSYFLGIGVICALLLYLVSYNGHLLFHGVFASLMLSAICEYAMKIYFYRVFV